MKLSQVNNSLKVIKDYFENEKIDFSVANKMCDLMDFLETSSERYNRLMQKFLNENYNYTSDKDGSNPVWTIKDDSKEEIVRVQKEKYDLDNIEIEFERTEIKQIEKITPKVLAILREFFIFEGEQQ